MQNITPRAVKPLSSLAQQVAEALHAWQAPLGIFYNTEERVLGDLAAAGEALFQHREAIAKRIDAVRAQELARRQAYEFVTTVRDLLRRKLGTRYSERWGDVGFWNRTLKIPPDIDGLLSRLISIEHFYATHAEWQVPNLATQDMAAELQNTLAEKVHTVLRLRAEQREKKIIRDKAIAALRLRVQRLYGELKQVLSKDDPRWLTFGFNVPGDVRSSRAVKDPIADPETSIQAAAEPSITPLAITAPALAPTNPDIMIQDSRTPENISGL